MKKKPIIELKINHWNKLSKREQQKATSWVIALFADFSSMRKRGVAGDFTGEYP